MNSGIHLKKAFTVLLHAGVWVIVFSMPYLLQYSSRSEESQNDSEEHNFYLALITNICWVGLFYLNAYLLIPRLIYKKQYGRYIVITVLLLAWMIFQTAKLFQLFYNRAKIEPGMHLMFVLFVFLLILASSTAYRMIRDRMETERTAKEKETETLKTELSFLRSQVSPHFMFNVLNNMVALARKKSDDLEPSLIKLSSLLRYMLYETNEDKVALEKEIGYLKSFIDLQTQRFGNRVVIQVKIEEPDDNYFIEPMLLIPFVENAFKHGIGMAEKPFISINLNASNHQLYFAVSNHFNELEEVKDKTPGIGLQNVTRRLDLLYKNEHSLFINKDDNYFTVELKITLH